MSEARLVVAILKNLRDSYGVKINVSPSFERGMATPVETGTGSRIIMVGASHMCRTAEFLPDCVNLAYPGFRIEKDMISNVEIELRKLNVVEGDTVVLDLLSNAAFMGTDDDGLPTPASRAGDGRYHIIGSLTTSPPTALKRLWPTATVCAGSSMAAKYFWSVQYQDTLQRAAVKTRHM
jgi:hypothetical protein